MIGVTVFGLIFTPVFYVVTRKLSEKLPQPPGAARKDASKENRGDDAPSGQQPEPSPST